MGEAWTIILAILGITGSAYGATMAYRANRKGDKATATLTERRDTIADRDGMIAGLKQDVATLKADMESQKAETSKLRTEIEHVRDHNNALITYAYKLIGIIRGNGLAEQLPKPPPSGIHI